MNEEQSDFLDKLILVTREAETLAEDLPAGINKTRAEHITMVLRLLKARFDVMAPVILPTKKTPP